MKTRKQVIDELNDAKPLTSSYEFKMMMACLSILGIIFLLALMGIVEAFGDWIDSKAKFISLFLTLTGVIVGCLWLGWYLIWGRKK